MWLTLLKRSVRSSLCVLAIAASGAAAQTELPKGWFLHDDQAPTLTLTYYNPFTGDVDISVTCTSGYTDTIVALYPKSGEATDGRHMTITLARDHLSHSINATGNASIGRYVIDGATMMQPELIELLVGGFTVAVNGQGMGTYAPNKGNMKHVKALTEACRE
jgi:hypothetical protein